jgi:hypothetical protein
MTLTDAEIGEAARRLARSGKKDWALLSEREREGFCMVVSTLAAELDVEHSPEALLVFMTWMGDEC